MAQQRTGTFLQPILALPSALGPESRPCRKRTYSPGMIGGPGTAHVAPNHTVRHVEAHDDADLGFKPQITLMPSAPIPVTLEAR